MKISINKAKANKEKIINHIVSKLCIFNSTISFQTLCNLFLFQGGTCTNSKSMQTLVRMFDRISTYKKREVFNLKEQIIVKTVFDEFLISFCNIFNTYSQIVKLKYDIEHQFIGFINFDYDNKKEVIKTIEEITPVIVELLLSMLESFSKGETPWLKSEYKLEYNGETYKELIAYFYTDKIEINNYEKEQEDIEFYRKTKLEEKNSISFLENLGKDSIPSKFFLLKDKTLSYRKHIERLNFYKFYKINRIELKQENPFCFIPKENTSDFLIPIYGEVSFETFSGIFEGLEDGYDRVQLSQNIKIL